jgi:hypothetical protein
MREVNEVHEIKEVRNRAYPANSQAQFQRAILYLLSLIYFLYFPSANFLQ